MFQKLKKGAATMVAAPVQHLILYWRRNRMSIKFALAVN